jgi:hypothetical protein
VQRAVAAFPLVLVPALGATQGGFQPDAWVWAGALAAWACALALVLSRDPGALRRAWPWAAAAGLLLLWTLASALWSANAAQSVLEARRMLLYAAVVFALLLLARRDAPRLLVPATHLAISGLLTYALARYLFTARHFDTFEQYNLTQPLGYANAIGILAVFGILLAVGLVASEIPRARRAAVAATVPILAAALVLSQSTASDMALGVGLAVTALLTPGLLRLLRALLLIVPGGAIAFGLATYSHLAANVPNARFSGHALAVIVVACAALSAAAVACIRLPDTESDARRTRRIMLAAVVVLALGGAAVVARAGSTEPRASYYRVAWRHEVLTHPLLGTGAGTFGHYWVRFGKPLDFGGALDVHSLYLESLAELGPLGLLLVGAFLLAPLRGVIRRRGIPYVPAAAGAYAAFLVHAGLDWDWEVPAVVVSALCCGAAVATADLQPGRALSGATRYALLAVTFVLGACAIAGARSHTVPAARAPETQRAPHNGALSQTRA